METRKILFILSALALALHAVWDIVRQLPFFSEWYKNNIWGHPLRIEIFWLPYTWLFLGGILLALIAVLVKTDEPKPTYTRTDENIYGDFDQYGNWRSEKWIETIVKEINGQEIQRETRTHHYRRAITYFGEE